MSRIDLRQLVSDYGEDVSTARGARRHLGQVRRRPPIRTAGTYVAICRRIDWRLDWHREGALRDGSADGRLIAAGFRRVPPKRMVREVLPQLVRYVDQAWPDWNRGWGSPYCPALPPVMLEAMLRGVQPRAVGLLGERALRLRRGYRQHFILRAAARSSIEDQDRWTLKALAALGRLCPELQRVAVQTVPGHLLDEQRWWDLVGARLGGPRWRRVRVGDVDWERVAEMQCRLQRDEPWVRYSLACGKRREMIARDYGVEEVDEFRALDLIEGGHGKEQ